jgi:hypothetical protein
MMGRLIATATLLLLAFYAVWENVLGAGLFYGILFLFFAAVTWFKWEAVRDGFSAAKDESQLPIIRLGSKIIGGMQTSFRGPPRRRPSS